jgi:hypothetical protein
VWLNKIYGAWIKSKNDTSVSDDSDNEIDTLKNKIKIEKPFNVAPNDGKNERVVRAFRQTSKLKSRFKPNPTRFIENSDSGRELVLEKADIAPNFIDCLKVPETFEDSYYHPNHGERMKWREAISKELNEMKEKEVYEKSELPNGRTCIKNKCAFKIQLNVIFRVPLVACGYSQVPGVDFQENCAPMINDVTFRILLIMMLNWNSEGKIVDIETAFLHGSTWRYPEEWMQIKMNVKL